MNKKIFVVSDTNREYTERFIRCLEAWEGSRFEIRGFTEKECLSEQLAARPADILLISEAMLGMDPEFRGQLEASSRRMLVLSEQSGGGGEEHFVYRYQPLDRILRQIAAYCEEQEPWEEDAALHAEIYGVYSPVKRCYKTTFSLILGQILADRGTTLYVNLEDCSWPVRRVRRRCRTCCTVTASRSRSGSCAAWYRTWESWLTFRRRSAPGRSGRQIRKRWRR